MEAKPQRKSARECADEMMKKGGDHAKAIRYAIGYGAGLEKRRPGTADKFMAKAKPNKR